MHLDARTPSVPPGDLTNKRKTQSPASRLLTPARGAEKGFKDLIAKLLHYAGAVVVYSDQHACIFANARRDQ